MNATFFMRLSRLFVCVLAFVGCGRENQSKPNARDTTVPHAADLMVGKEAGDLRDDNGLKMKFVWCPSGKFTMRTIEEIGRPVITEDELDKEDKPAVKTQMTLERTEVKVVLTQGNWVGKYEVTQSEWVQVMHTEPWKGQPFTKEGGEFPASWINWNDAMTFCRKLTDDERNEGRLATDWEYSLPTEAQWEHACRAGTESKFSFGNDDAKLGEYAWFIDNAQNAAEKYAHRVGQKEPNPWGLNDMHGNVLEWCRDNYVEKVPGGYDPFVTKGTANRVLRGGTWSNSAGRCQSGSRYNFDPSFQFIALGFRVALCKSPNK